MVYNQSSTLSISLSLSLVLYVCASVCISPQFFFLTLMKSELFIILYSFVRWLVGFVHSSIRCVCSVFGFYWERSLALSLSRVLLLYWHRGWSSCRTTHTSSSTTLFAVSGWLWLLLARPLALTLAPSLSGVWCARRELCICISEFFFFLYFLVYCCLLCVFFHSTRLIYISSKYSKRLLPFAVVQMHTDARTHAHIRAYIRTHNKHEQYSVWPTLESQGIKVSRIDRWTQWVWMKTDSERERTQEIKL